APVTIPKNPVVAVDGPAGSGKSTVARAVAEALGLPALDTGAMYRALTWAVLDAGIDPADTPAVIGVAQRLDLDVGPPVRVGGRRAFGGRDPPPGWATRSKNRGSRRNVVGRGDRRARRHPGGDPAARRHRLRAGRLPAGGGRRRRRPRHHRALGRRRGGRGPGPLPGRPRSRRASVTDPAR